MKVGIFSLIEWSFLDQRPQHFAKTINSWGHSVVYFEPFWKLKVWSEEGPHPWSDYEDVCWKNHQCENGIRVIRLLTIPAHKNLNALYKKAQAKYDQRNIECIKAENLDLAIVVDPFTAYLLDNIGIEYIYDHVDDTHHMGNVIKEGWDAAQIYAQKHSSFNIYIQKNIAARHGGLYIPNGINVDDYKDIRPFRGKKLFDAGVLSALSDWLDLESLLKLQKSLLLIGPAEEPLRQDLIKKSTSDKNIYDFLWLGRQPRVSAFRWLQLCRTALIPFSDGHPIVDYVMPLKLIEYLYLGIPVVTYLNPVLDEEFSDYVTFYSSSNWKGLPSLDEAIATASQSDHDYSGMRSIAERYSWPEILKPLKAVLHRGDKKPVNIPHPTIDNLENSNELRYLLTRLKRASTPPNGPPLVLRTDYFLCKKDFLSNKRLDKSNLPSEISELLDGHPEIYLYIYLVWKVIEAGKAEEVEVSVASTYDQTKKFLTRMLPEDWLTRGIGIDFGLVSYIELAHSIWFHTSFEKWVSHEFNNEGYALRRLLWMYVYSWNSSSKAILNPILEIRKQTNSYSTNQFPITFISAALYRHRDLFVELNGEVASECHEVYIASVLRSKRLYHLLSIEQLAWIRSNYPALMEKECIELPEKLGRLYIDSINCWAPELLTSIMQNKAHRDIIGLCTEDIMKTIFVVNLLLTNIEMKADLLNGFKLLAQTTPYSHPFVKTSCGLAKLSYIQVGLVLRSVFSGDCNIAATDEDMNEAIARTNFEESCNTLVARLCKISYAAGFGP